MQVVEYILDRNACLLPAYLAVTEIRKLYPEGALSHWVCTNRAGVEEKKEIKRILKQKTFSHCQPVWHLVYRTSSDVL